MEVLKFRNVDQLIFSGAPLRSLFDRSPDAEPEPEPENEQDAEREREPEAESRLIKQKPRIKDLSIISGSNSFPKMTLPYVKYGK